MIRHLIERADHLLHRGRWPLLGLFAFFVWILGPDELIAWLGAHRVVTAALVALLWLAWRRDL